MISASVEIRALGEVDRPRLRELLAREWGSAQIVSRGEVHDASEAPAIGAFCDEELVGLATYLPVDGECELLTLNAFEPRRGIGSALLESVAAEAKAAGCRRLWLVTSNDNLGAIAFYERRGLRLAAVHQGAIDEARKLKPAIPEFGEGGVRISDELEFELDL